MCIRDSLIKENNAAGIKDMGKVMGLASKALAGKADGKTIAEDVYKRQQLPSPFAQIVKKQASDLYKN